MLEESINSSPQENKRRSIHSVRLHRKNKRKRRIQHDTGTNVCLPNIDRSNDLPTLENMYWESTSYSNETIARQNDLFNPFEDELILAAADRLQPAEMSHRRTGITKELIVKNFIQCEELKARNKEIVCPVAEVPLVGPETQFGITESEFARFCEEAEDKVAILGKETVGKFLSKEEKPSERPTSIPEKILRDFCGDSSKESPEKTSFVTPKRSKAKSTVDSILNDFCGSPLSPDFPSTSAANRRTLAEDCTPIFQFKNKTIRTYGNVRSKKARTSIASKLETAFYEDSDGNVSDASSGLSIQEDLTQHVNSVETVDLNNSNRVCENLQNLSSYFSQKLSGENVELQPEMGNISSKVTESNATLTLLENKDESNERLNKNTESLIGDIVSLRSKYNLNDFKRKCMDEFEFYGFPSREQNENLKISDQNYIAEIDLNAQDVNSQTLKQNSETFSKEKCNTNIPTKNVNFLENLVNNVHRILNQDNKNISFEQSPKSIRNQRGCSPNNCDKNVEDGEQLLVDDEDDWNDNCDFFKQFKTQDVFNSSSAKFSFDRSMYSSHALSSNNPIDISKGADLKVDTIQKNSFKIPDQPPSEHNFLGFRTASHKKITISEEATNQAKKILEHLPEIGEKTKNLKESLSSSCSKSAMVQTVTPKAMGICHKVPAVIHSSNKEVKFVGFTTASHKAIPVSDEAKQKAAKILQNLPEITESSDEDLLKVKDSSPIDSYVAQKALTSFHTTEIIGFKTASCKTIVISEEAKKCADKILQDLPEITEEAQFLSKSSNLKNVLDKSIEKNAHKNLNNPNSYNISTYKIKNRTYTPKISTKPPQEVLQDSKIISKQPVASKADDKCSKILQIKSPQLLCLVSRKAPGSLETASINDDNLRDESLLSNTNILEAPGETSPQTAMTHSIKRQFDKLSKSNTDVNNPTPVLKTLRRSISMKSQTPLSPVENQMLKSFLMHKDRSSKTSVISRKNLLSLSKRNRFKSTQRTLSNEHSLAERITPNKSNVIAENMAQSAQHPETPNFKEFIDLIPTSSTPLIKGKCILTGPLLKTASPIDKDFQKIQWDDCNDSKSRLKPLNISDSSFANVTKPNPSPMQRIERLRMYGNPSPISPIPFANNCRPSGLRRARSIIKQ